MHEQLKVEHMQKTGNRDKISQTYAMTQLWRPTQREKLIYTCFHTGGKIICGGIIEELNGDGDILSGIAVFCDR